MARIAPRLFAPYILVKWHCDDNFYYLESTGIPTHRMMVGITAWQQQVPLPQDFTGDNAFRIPRHPVLAKDPVSAKKALFNGAIAVAVNGIPIFNPIKNDGRTDTYLAGELDEFGGHCGRADDHHYHTAPLHLVEVVGKANPIAWAPCQVPKLRSDRPRAWGEYAAIICTPSSFIALPTCVRRCFSTFEPALTVTKK